MNQSDAYTVRPVGIAHSPFVEKFGIPRQPGLVPAAKGRIELLPPFGRPEWVRGLEAVSHIWVSFLFHQVAEDSVQATVRPPRLGGNTRVGVFASRSPFRPNRLGLSVLQLDRIDVGDSVSLLVSGMDLLDGTPVLDIKPYVAWCDSIADAGSGFASERPTPVLTVSFSSDAEKKLEQLAIGAATRQLIIETLSLDVRPAWHDDAQRMYGTKIQAWDVRWRVDGDALIVCDIC